MADLRITSPISYCVHLSRLWFEPVYSATQSSSESSRLRRLVAVERSVGFSGDIWPRLCHSPFAQHWRQAFAYRQGCSRGLSMALVIGHVSYPTDSPAASRLGLCSSLTHWGRDKMDAISQTTVSNRFSWLKMYKFQLKFHWSLFLMVQLTIFQHWFR